MSSKQDAQSSEVLLKPDDFNINVTTVLNQCPSMSSIMSESVAASVPSKSAECYQCNKTFPTFAEAVMHLKLIHNACAFKDCSRLSNFKLHSSVCANRGLGCAICNKKFQDKHLLLTHFYEHIDAALYACEVCREGFQQRKDLQKHFFQIHNKFLSIPVTSLNKTVYQKCLNCSKYFKLFAEYEEHVSSCTSLTYACYICKVSFGTVPALEEHKLKEHSNEQVVKGNRALKQGKRYFCGLCFLGFFKGGILKEHVMTHKIETKHICDVCHVSFSCDGDLQAHYLQHIEEHYVLYDVINQHSCTHCKKMFKTLKELKDHIIYKNCRSNSRSAHSKKLSARNNTECLLSDKENTAESDDPLIIPDNPVYVLKVGEDLLNCDDSECVVVMDHASYYVLQRGVCASENRMPDAKNSEIYTEQEYPETSSIENYMVSILTAHNDKLLNPENMSDDNETLYLERNSEADNVETIILNINECNDGSMQCEFVGDDSTKGEFEFLVYENSSNMAELSTDSNKVIIHEDKMEFDIEDYIQSEDSINKELLIETDNALDISGLYICNICKQVFSSKTSLSLHMKGSHTGYDCYRCGASFLSEEELKSHERIHLNAFQCDLCEASYPKENLLKNHKESAHGKMNFACNACKKVFATKNEYDIHMTLHKSEIMPTQCEECGKMYASVSSYMNHKATHISSDKFICTICDKVFQEQSSLKVHLATHMRKSPYNFECPKCKMFFPPKMISRHVETHIDIVSS